MPSPGTLDAGSVSSRLNALSFTSARRCRAVGSDVGYLSETLHWRDGKWRTAPVPSPSNGQDAFNELSGVSCSGDTNCWAVGWAASGALKSGGLEVNQILHWTGHKWAVAG